MMVYTVSLYEATIHIKLIYHKTGTLNPELVLQ